MPLQFQLSQWPFRFGLQEGVDPHQVPPGTLTTAENVRWSKSGRIEKRYGTSAALSRSTLSAGTVTAAARLFTRGSELCLIDGATLYSWSPAVSQWVATGPAPELGLNVSTLVDTAEGISAVDVALTSDNRVVCAWVSAYSGYVYYQVYDLTSGVRSQAPTLLFSTATSTQVRVLASGTDWYVLLNDGSNVRMFKNAVAVNSVISDGTTNCSFDAVFIGATLVVAYSKSATGLSLKSFTFVGNTATLAASGSVASEAANFCSSISIDGQASEALYVAYLSNNAGSPVIRWVACNSSTLATTTSVQTLANPSSGTITSATIGVKRFDATSCVAIFSAFTGSVGVNTAWTSNHTEAWLVLNTGSGTQLASQDGYQILSKPFIQSGTCYVVLGDANNSAYGIVSSYVTSINVASGFDNLRYVGKIDQFLGGQFTKQPANVVAVSSSRSISAVPFQSIPFKNMSRVRQGARLVSFLTGASLPPNHWNAVTYNQEAYLAAGVLCAYDGNSAFDYGYCNAANYNLYAYAGSLTGGSLDSNGSYIYSYVPEYKSGVGVLHRGTSTVALTANLALLGAPTTTASVTLTLVSPSLSWKRTYSQRTTDGRANRVAVYRSTKGGTSLYRLTFEPTDNIVPLASLQSTFVDTNSDSAVGSSGTALSARPLIYTTGGILDDEQPPGLLTLCLHKQRLWGVDVSGSQVWYSKSFLDDYGTAPGFSSSFRVQFDQAVTALASMDEKLIAFGSDRLWYLLGGDNITPNGAQSDLQGPFSIQSDVGCTNSRSVVSMPDGVMFQSARGLYLLTRGLELVWIGRPVKDQLAAYPYITSAVLVASRNEIRFTANSGANNTGNGVVLVYNYVEKQWSTSKYTGGSAGYGTPIADAVMWNGVWTFATPDGYVYSETTTSFCDAGSTANYIPMTLETAWVSAAGPLAFHSMRSMQLEGISYSNHDLTLSVGFDNDTSYPQSTTFTAGSPVTAISNFLQAEITIGTRRKCQAIRFKVQDATPTNPGTYPVGTGQGPSFDMMGVQVGIKQGFAVNPATKKG